MTPKSAYERPRSKRRGIIHSTISFPSTPHAAGHEPKEIQPTPMAGVLSERKTGKTIGPSAAVPVAVFGILMMFLLMMALLNPGVSPAAGQESSPPGPDESPLLEAEGGESIVQPEVRPDRPNPMMSDRFTPGARTIIPREKFSDTQQTVADVLEEVPGVTLTRSGDGNSPTQIRIRGSRADQVLILVDGVPMGGGTNAPSQRRRENRAGLDLATLALSRVESIEVVRGAASGIYGAGAAAGAVLIRTRESIDPSLEVFTTIGSGGYLEGDVLWSLVRSGGDAPNDVLTFHLNRRQSEGKYIYFDSEAALTTQTTPQDNPCAIALGNGYFERGCNASRFTSADIRWRREAMRLGLFLEDTQRRGLQGVESPQPFGREVGRRFRLTYGDRFPILAQEDEGQTSSALLWDARYERTQLERDGMTLDGIPAAGRFTDDRTGLTGAWEHWRGIQRFLIGLGAEVHQLSDTRFAANRTTRFARGEYTLHREQGSWEAAIRHDRLSDLGGETTWRAALAEALWEGWGIKASHGRGTRPPSLHELYDPGTLTGSAAATAANPDLRTEQTLTSDGGIFFDREDRVYFEALAFRHDADDTIIAIPAGSGSNLLRLENVSRTRSTGTETSLGLRWPNGWSADAGWTRTDAIIIANNGGDPREIGNRLPGIPRDRYTLAAAWRSEGRHVWLQSRHQGERFIDSANSRFLKPYTLVDAGLTLPLSGNWSLSLTGRNLTNITYAEIDNFPPPGRQGFLTLRWKRGGAPVEGHAASGGFIGTPDEKEGISLGR